MIRARQPGHRPEQDEARATDGFVIAPDHPALAGHFPGHPVVPGVILLDHAIVLIGAALAQPLEIFQLGSVKFLSPVSPGEPVILTHATDARGTIHFALSANGRAVASGTLTPPGPAPQAGENGA